MSGTGRASGPIHHGARRPGVEHGHDDGRPQHEHPQPLGNGLGDFGRPDGWLERQVDRWYAHLKAFRFRDIPGLDEAGRWLRAHKPSTYTPGIIHGDYQFANVMYRHGGPARMAAISASRAATISGSEACAARADANPLSTP